LTSMGVRVHYAIMMMAAWSSVSNKAGVALGFAPNARSKRILDLLAPPDYVRRFPA